MAGKILILFKQHGQTDNTSKVVLKGFEMIVLTAKILVLLQKNVEIEPYSALALPVDTSNNDYLLAFSAVTSK